MISAFHPDVALAPENRERALGTTLIEGLRAGADAGGLFEVVGDGTMPGTELVDRSENLARGMINQGFEPGDRVALWFRNSIDLAVWAFAAVAAGGGAIFIPPRAHPNEVRKYAAAGSARWIISGSDIEGGLITGEARRRFEDASSSIVLPLATPESEAFCFTTSGSTGSPKLCRLTHRNVAAGILGSQAGMGGDADDVVLCPIPMSHIAFVTQVTTSLVQGRTAVACDFEATSCFQLVKDRGVTVLGMSPTMWGLLMERNSFPDPGFQLRRALYGSSAMPAHWAEQLIRTLSGCELVHMYGMTESSGHVTVLPPELVVDKAGSAGLALPLVDQLAILDPDGEVLRTGEVGEICAQGPFVTPGYIDRPQDTAEALRGGWLHSGDLGHLDGDGCLWISGRIKDQINRGGLKIGAREVEEIIEGIASVTGVAVVGIPDPFLTELVAAVVEVSPDSGLDAEAIRVEVAGQLADYKVPERVLLVETLPRSDMQKPDKPAIRKLLAETS